MIEIGRFGIWDFENVFGKEITSNGPILDSWWQVHVHTNRKIRFTFRISNLLSVKTLLSVSFLSGFSGKSCQVSVCCPNFVRIYCPVSVCPDSICLDSVRCPDYVQIFWKMMSIVSVRPDKDETALSCRDFRCPCPLTSTSNDLRWPEIKQNRKKYQIEKFGSLNKLIVTIRKYRFKIFVAAVKFCCVWFETGFGTFCILVLMMSIRTF